MHAAFLRTHQESMYFVQHKLPNKLLALINWEKSLKNYILRQTYEQKMIIYEKKSFEFSTLWLLFRAGGTSEKLVGQVLSIVWQLLKTGRAAYSKFHKNWKGSCPTCQMVPPAMSGNQQRKLSLNYSL